MVRYVTYITEVSFKKTDGQECLHKDWNACSECEPSDMTLIGHYDLNSTIALARQQGRLGLNDQGFPSKELLVQFYAIDKGKKVPPHLLEHFTEFEGPSQYIVDLADRPTPLNNEITND